MKSDDLSELLARLLRELRNGMPSEMRHRLVTACAASELLMSDLERQDPAALRIAIARYVLEAIGISDSDIESARLVLRGTPASQLSTWRH